jgi:3-oxosteroid 1-dehydrogenase
MSETDRDHDFDVIVVGSGTGLIGAYAAASRGLRTLVLESAPRVGGMTAHSGAGIWLPGNPAQDRAGMEDGPDLARPYLDAIIGDDAPVALREAYLLAGPRLIEDLERNQRFRSFRWRGVPDYYPEAPGALAVGRTVFPPKIARSELGELEPLLRRPIWSERFGAEPEDVLVGGQALIARALLALIETGNATVRVDTALDRLVVDDDGAVVGVEAISGGERVRFTARRGVLLAAGGYERNRELRQRHQAPVTDEWTQGPPENTGAALEAAIDVGAGTALLDEAWFAPGIVVPDALPVFYTMVWSGIWVNAAGERFMNERLPYDRAGHEIVAAHRASAVSHIPTYWVFDQRQIDNARAFRQLPVEPQFDGWFDVDRWEAAGVLDRAGTLEGLAGKIGMPPGALTASVEEFNRFARSGVDERFHRGETPWDLLIVQLMGAHEDGPNPCLGVIDRPPFYAIRVVPTDLGTKGGVTTDEHARVLRADGSVIVGLYAAGNTMAPMSGRVYPGAGVPVGSGMVFSYLAALDMAGEPLTIG